MQRCRIFSVSILAALSIGSSISTGKIRAFNMSDQFQPGRINNPVVCKSNVEQTYALFVPSNYSPNRKWPLIAAFDPGARGVLPVERFKEAAERYGYIVCGSNNSHNGPLRPSADAAKAMLTDVTEKFAIDEKRIYLTGFSGGARAATGIAVWLSGQIAGVIGCGAGFAEGVAADASVPFVYYGTVGTDDFNYPEMTQLDRTLEQARVPHHIAVFEGGHDWAPSDECVRAIEWMELQAMRSGRRSRDDAFIDRLLKTELDQANASQSVGRTYEAYVAYASIAADFKDLREVVEFENKAALLKNSKPIKAALAKARDQENEQKRRAAELFGLRAKAQEWISDPETQRPFLSDLKRLISDLRRKSAATDNTPERAVARRVLNQFTIASFEETRGLLQSRQYDLAAARLAVDAELTPDNWQIWYNLACAYALAGNKRSALDALNKSVQKGFSNPASLESDHQLDSIRNETAFKKILQELNQKR